MTSGSNLVLLCWSCVLARHVYTNTDLCNGAQWSRLVEVQCLALHGVLSAGTACVCQAARKKLHRVWREVWCKFESYIVIFLHSCISLGISSPTLFSMTCNASVLTLILD